MFRDFLNVFNSGMHVIYAYILDPTPRKTQHVLNAHRAYALRHPWRKFWLREKHIAV